MTTTAPARPRPPIDPRIRARRIAVQRDEGRRRLRRVVALLVVVVALVAVVGVSLSPLLDVDRVVVEGAAASGPRAVVAASGIRQGQAMVTVDVGAARAAVARLPWVASAEVERDWPGSVRIVVEERTPVAAVAVDGGVADGAAVVLVDAEGHRLALVDEAPTGLVAITGVDAGEQLGDRLDQAGRAALELIGLLPDSLRAQVTGVAVGDDGDLQAGLSPGEASLSPEEASLSPGKTRAITVRFGRPAGLAAKVLAVATVLDSVDPRGLDVIDVRVPGSPVLTRR